MSCNFSKTFQHVFHAALLVLVTAFALSAVPANAAPSSPSFACSKTSPPHTVALLELYTSEGCDSCPPADRFLSSVFRNGLQGGDAIPLALHVDYWDAIGWKDPFGSKLFSERQRRLSALAGSRTVYTPEFFLSGREWRAALSTSALPLIEAVARINARPARAELTLSLPTITGNTLPARIEVKAPSGAMLYVALYERGLSSRVTAGENRGATLQHDFVVRDWLGPIAINTGATTASLPRPLMIPPGDTSRQLGVTAFVQDGKGDILQAVSLPACR